MNTLIKQALLSRQFYKSEYKKVTRAKTFLFFVFIGLIYAFVLSPVNSYLLTKGFESLKTEFSAVPKALEVSLKNGTLTSNFTKPLQIKLTSDSYLVFDPKNSFREVSKESSYIVFKEKGYVLVTNGKTVSQERYLDSVDLGFNFSNLSNYLNSVSAQTVFLYSLITFILLNFVDILVQVVLNSFIFGLIYFFIFNRLKNKEVTYMQSVKKFIFLSIYFVLALLIGNVLGFAQSAITLVIFFIAYFYLARS